METVVRGLDHAATTPQSESEGRVWRGHSKGHAERSTSYSAMTKVASEKTLLILRQKASILALKNTFVMSTHFLLDSILLCQRVNNITLDSA